MKLPRPRAEFFELRPHVQPCDALAGFTRPIRLSCNESSYGPSSRAIAAYREAEQFLHRYPDSAQQQLREAIADVHNLSVARIICGNGSEELIGLLMRAYLAPEDEVVLSENHFIMCEIYARAQGARIVVAPEVDYRIDVDAVLGHVTENTRMVAIANPNNPTGTYLCSQEIRRLQRELPSHVMLLLDAAYSEYVLADDFEDGTALVQAQGNVVVTRTFSKIYGLAGLRVGWAYCPSNIIEVLQRIRTPFNVNRAALVAATQAVRDVEYVREVRFRNAQAQQFIREELARLGLRVIASVTNFYLLDFHGVPGRSARGAWAFLESRGVIARPQHADHDHNTLRVTIGSRMENEAVVAALRDYLDVGKA